MPTLIGMINLMRNFWPVRIFLFSICLYLVSASIFPVHAQSTDPRFKNELTNPVVQGELFLQSQNAYAWKDSGSTVTLLDRHVKIAVGGYSLEADRAVVVMTPRQTGDQKFHDVRMFLDKASEVTENLAVRQRASFLFVTATVAGSVKMQAGKLHDESRHNDDLVKRAYERFQLFDSGQRISQEGVLDRPGTDGSAVVDTRPRGTDGKAVNDLILDPNVEYRGDKPSDPKDRYVLFVSAEKISHIPGKPESYLALVGRIELMYYDTWERTSRTLKADKAVIFGDEGVFSGMAGTITGDSIKGIYLEDNVVIKAQGSSQDEDYTIRGPRMFYDLATDRAVVLNAVMYTWDDTLKLPLYARAKELRQESNQRWVMKDAQFTTSEFGVPHFAIGVDELVVTRSKGIYGKTRTYFLGENATFKIMNVPVMWAPFIAGDDDMPIRDVGAASSSNLGNAFGVTFGFFELIGQPIPFGVDSELSLDWYLNHGPGIGYSLDYDVPTAYGNFFGYFVYDFGPKSDEAEPGGREEVDPGAEFRGYLTWEHRQIVNRDWSVTALFAFASDPVFVEQFFQSEARAARTLSSSLEAKYQKDEVVFSALIEGMPNGFSSQMIPLQTEPYYIERLPELSYYRVGTPFFDGRLNLFSDNSLTAYRVQGWDATPSDYGFSNADSMTHFGISNSTSFKDATQAMGYDEDFHFRLDTRQEINVPFSLFLGRRGGGTAINLTPYAIGRLTIYDEEYDQVSDAHEAFRFWGAVGVRMNTAFYSTYGVKNELLDIQGLRHIIEPSIDMFYAETNVARQHMPRLDTDVEEISEGAVVRFNLRNTLKTRRGPRDAQVIREFLRLDAGLVLNEDRTDTGNPYPHFVGFRPELSNLGSHAYLDGAWYVTEALIFRGNMLYDFTEDEFRHWTVGWTLSQGDVFSTSLSLTDWQPYDTMNLNYSINLRLNSYYDFTFAQSFDVEDAENLSYTLQMSRKLPRWRVLVSLTVDALGDNRVLAVQLIPEGLESNFQVFDGNLGNLQQVSPTP